MPYDLDRTPTYRLSVKELGPLASLQLRLAERFIRARADQLPNALATRLGGRTVTLFGFSDLLFYVEPLHSGIVSMYLVVDRKNLPDWFVFPTGTWFEDIDLTD